MCRSTIDHWTVEEKRMKDRVSSVIVGVADNNCTRGGPILHEQEYNTRHGVSAIPNEIHGEIRRKPRQPEVKQPVVHLLLEIPMGWNGSVSGLSVQATSQPPESAY